MKNKCRGLITSVVDKRIKIADAIFFLLFILCIMSVLKSKYEHDLSIDKEFTIINPWMMKYDQEGNGFIIDNECSRVVKVDSNQKVEIVINGSAPEGNTFYYADSVAIAENGDIFVLDTGWSETGFTVASESILRYNSKGEFQEYCYEVYYDDIYCDKHRIFGLTTIENEVYFVSADEKGFQLNKINSTSLALEVIQSYTFEDAITLIQDFAIQTNNLEIYGIDKRGAIICGLSSGEVETVYSSDKAGSMEEKSALYRAGVGESGNVYITNISLDKVVRFNKKDSSKGLVDVITGTKNWNVAVSNNAGKEYISVAGYDGIKVVNADMSEIYSGDTFAKTNKYMLKEGLFDLSFLVCTIAALYLLIRLVGVLCSLTYSYSQKIGFIVALSVTIVTIVIVSELIDQFKDMYRGELVNKLSMSAQIVSNTMDVEALKNVNYPEDYMNDDYKRLIVSMNTTIDKNYSYSDNMYCNIMKYDGEEAYVIAYQDNSIGAYFPLSEGESKDVRSIYETGETVQSDVTSETGSYIYVEVPVYDNDGETVVGVISVGTLVWLLSSQINGMVKMIIISLIMIILIIMFLFSEVFSFFDLKAKHKEEVEANKNAVPLHIVRVVVFVTFMAFNMATSFLPVFVAKFVAEDLGIPKELAASLPLSVNLICIGLTSLICAQLMKTFGFRRIAAISAVIAIMGDITLALSSNYIMIVAGLILNGIGVGIITNSIHMYIAASDNGNKVESKDGYAFSIFNAASLSGINCGMVFGAALAEGLGQNKVFVISAVAWGFVALVFIAIGKSIVMKTSIHKVEETVRNGFKEFFFSKSILGFIIFVQLPYIIINSFTYYYVPIFGDANGLGETETCLLIMVSSLCSVYLSVTLTKFLSEKIHSNTIYLSSILCYAALLIFAFRMSIPTLIIALVMIGIANSFGTSERITYFISMKKSKEYGEEKSMGIYNFIDNIGESAGPVIFAGIISAGILVGTAQLVAISTSLNTLFAATKMIKKKE